MNYVGFVSFDTFCVVYNRALINLKYLILKFPTPLIRLIYIFLSLIIHITPRLMKSLDCWISLEGSKGENKKINNILEAVFQKGSLT